MRSKKRGLSREEVDDQKFRNAMEGVRFRARVEREANEALVCPGCGRSDWRMQPKCLINIVANDLIATMVCRKCKRKLPYATYMEEPYPEDEHGEVDEFELEYITDILCGRLGLRGINPFERGVIKDRIRQRLLMQLT